jgi:hypothetical protein
VHRDRRPRCPHLVLPSFTCVRCASKHTYADCVVCVRARAPCVFRHTPLAVSPPFAHPATVPPHRPSRPRRTAGPRACGTPVPLASSRSPWHVRQPVHPQRYHPQAALPTFTRPHALAVTRRVGIPISLAPSRSPSPSRLLHSATIDEEVDAATHCQPHRVRLLRRRRVAVSITTVYMTPPPTPNHS